MSPADPAPIAPGTPAYRRLLGAVFLAGFAVFLVMYDTQGLLPQISADLGTGEALAGWTVAGTTLGMAVGMVPLSATALSRGLFTRMLAFLVLAALAGLLVAVMPSIGTLVAARVLQGVLISLVPASALALIGSRIERSAVTSATGVYLAGNTVGGLFSRVGPGLIAELADWRAAIGVMSMLCLLCAAGVALLRPPGGEAVALPLRSPVPAVRAVLARPRILAACVIGAMLMAAFNSAYTVVGFRLQGPGIGWGPGAANLVYLLYLLGTLTSARTGSIAACIGEVPAVLLSALAVAVGFWVALPEHPLAIIAGLALMTALFFVGHVIASASVSRAAPPGTGATASAVYLTFYYAGATAGSALGSLGFQHAGWAATASLATVWTLAAGAATLLFRCHLPAP